MLDERNTVGRPPLNLQRTHVSFSPETLERLDKIAGEKDRAKFIRLAVERALDIAELAETLKADNPDKAK
jgi:metal-responsive CopG/Arc/MetJ family transcriptional regulator